MSEIGQAQDYVETVDGQELQLSQAQKVSKRRKLLAKCFLKNVMAISARNNTCADLQYILEGFCCCLGYGSPTFGSFGPQLGIRVMLFFTNVNAVHLQLAARYEAGLVSIPYLNCLTVNVQSCRHKTVCNRVSVLDTCALHMDRSLLCG